MSNPSIQLPHLTDAPSSGQGEHVVQFYADDSFLIDALSRFIGGTLALGEPAVVIATAQHQKELDRRLSAWGVDTAKAALQGRYVVMDAGETLRQVLAGGSVDDLRFEEVIGKMLNKVRNAVAHRECRIAVFADLVALLLADGKPQEAIRVEQLWNDLGTSHAFSLLCAYPIAGFNHEHHVEPFLKICGQHSSVISSEGYVGLSEADRLRSIAQLQQKAQVLERELALRQKEEQFRLLVETVQDYAIFMLDPTGRIRSWNLGAERIKGYKAEEIMGRHFSCFYPQEDVSNGKPAYELVVAAKEGRFEDEGWRLRKDGSKFWANVIITAVRNASGELFGFAKVTRDVTEKMRAHQALQREVAERREAQRQLHKSEESMRQLSLHLLRTQDEERRIIGRDLHDSLGQSLTVLKLKLDSLAPVIVRQNEEFAQDLEQCVHLTEDCIREVRTMSYLLYPPLLEEMGLKSAVPWYLEGFSARSGITTSFEVQEDFGRLPRESELALFRVLQESLTNVHRHSESPVAYVRLLVKDGMSVLEIEDKGRGVSPQLLEQSGQDWTGALGVGLRGMNERMRQLGGRLELVSNQGGTKVSAIVPGIQSVSARCG